MKTDTIEAMFYVLPASTALIGLSYILFTSITM